MTVRQHRSKLLYDYIVECDTLLDIRATYAAALFQFTQDYILIKMVTAIMRKGKKAVALEIVWETLASIKQVFGFQPFFAFKDIVLGMRQLFKVYRLTIRQTKDTDTPSILQPHRQVSSGLYNVIAGAIQLCATERLKIVKALTVVLSNCFVYTRDTEKQIES